jgi:hypothetical protein
MLYTSYDNRLSSTTRILRKLLRIFLFVLDDLLVKGAQSGKDSESEQRSRDQLTAVVVGGCGNAELAWSLLMEDIAKQLRCYFTISPSSDAPQKVKRESASVADRLSRRLASTMYDHIQVEYEPSILPQLCELFDYLAQAYYRIPSLLLESLFVCQKEQQKAVYYQLFDAHSGDHGGSSERSGISVLRKGFQIMSAWKGLISDELHCEGKGVGLIISADSVRSNDADSGQIVLDDVFANGLVHSEAFFRDGKNSTLLH